MTKEADITVTGRYSLPYTVQVQVSVNLAISPSDVQPWSPWGPKTTYWVQSLVVAILVGLGRGDVSILLAVSWCSSRGSIRTEYVIFN